MRTSHIGAAKHIQRPRSTVESRRAVGARRRAQRQTLPVDRMYRDTIMMPE